MQPQTVRVQPPVRRRAEGDRKQVARRRDKQEESRGASLELWGLRQKTGSVTTTFSTSLEMPISPGPLPSKLWGWRVSLRNFPETRNCTFARLSQSIPLALLWDKSRFPNTPKHPFPSRIKIQQCSGYAKLIQSNFPKVGAQTQRRQRW